MKNGEDYSKKQAQLKRLEEQLVKLKCDKQDKDENKEIALGTSKLNYLDPRITVGWCKKWEVPIEKVINKCLCLKLKRLKLIGILIFLM